MPWNVLMIQAYLQLVADFKTLFGPEGQAAGLDVAELDDGLPAPAAQIRGAALMFLAVLCHGTGGFEATNERRDQGRASRKKSHPGKKSTQESAVFTAAAQLREALAALSTRRGPRYQQMERQSSPCQVISGSAENHCPC